MSDMSVVISSLQQTANKLAPNATKDATKQLLVLQFIAGVLGYNVWSPDEVIPAFTIDGINGGGTVDYAICRYGKPYILIECKQINEKLDNDYPQSFRYFTAIEHAPIVILTNGTEYRFFSNINAPNVVDSTPFMAFDIMRPDTALYKELEKLSKDKFDIVGITQAAERLKYEHTIMTLIKKQLTSPDESFVRYVMGEVYSGSRSRTRVEWFTPIVRNAMSKVIVMYADEQKQATKDTTIDNTIDVNQSDDCVSVQQPQLTVHTTTLLDLLDDGLLRTDDTIYLMSNGQKTDIKLSQSGELMIGEQTFAPSRAARLYLPHRKSANGWEHLGVMRDDHLVSLWQIRYQYEDNHGGVQGVFKNKEENNNQIDTSDINSDSAFKKSRKTQHLSIAQLMSMGVLSAGAYIKFDGSPVPFTLQSNGLVLGNDGVESSLSAAATKARNAKNELNGWLYASVLVDGVWHRLTDIRDEAEKNM